MAKIIPFLGAGVYMASDLEPALSFTTDRDTLKEAFAIVTRAVSGRSSLSVLQNVLIVGRDGKLDIHGSDNEMRIWLSIEADVDSPGALTLPASMTQELLASLSGQTVTISRQKSFGSDLVCGSSKYSLLGLPPDEYPTLRTIEGSTQFDLQSSVLSAMIPMVTYAVADDGVRPILTGVNMHLDEGQLTLAATDTHRLAVRSVPVTVTGSANTILPSRVMTELRRALTGTGDVKVLLGENEVRFELPSGVYLQALLIQGAFPNFQRVIPALGDKQWTIDRQDLIQIAKRASIVAKNSSHRIVLIGQGDSLRITAESSLDGKAVEELEMISKGANLTIALNVKYLLEALNAMSSATIILDLTEPLKACAIRQSGEDGSSYVSVLMPMQVA